MATASPATLAEQTGIPKWIFELCQGQVPNTPTISSAEEGFRLLDGKVILDGTRVLIMYQMIPLVKTLKEAKLLALASMRKDHKLLGRVQSRWNSIGQACVQEAQSFKDLMAILIELPPQSRSRREALTKAATFMRTFTEAKVLYNHAKDDWTVREAALRLMIDTASTFAEMREAYNTCLLGDPLQLRALNRWNELGQRELDKTRTLEEIRQVVRQLLSGSKAVEYAAKRALDITAL